MASRSDGDDDDLRQAIALSLQEQQGSSAEKPIALDEGLPKRPLLATHSSHHHGILGLNRKQMEEERLSRKRKTSPPPRPTTSKVMKGFTPVSIDQTKLERNPTFLRGVVKKTSVLGEPRSADTIGLEDILEREHLQLAVLSSFQWDIPWLFAKLNVSKTLITLVMQAKDETTREQYRRETADMPNLRICFPSMEGQINCMHSKLMLLSHKNYLRIVVPTANLVSYDWGETGTMENMCFIIDLPRLPETEQVEKLTFFGEELVYFLNAQRLEKSIVNSLYKFDFSNTRNIAFIHTIGGPHIGLEEPWRRTGFCGLGQAVERLGLDTDKEINVDFVTSSVGSLNLDFLSSLYLACQGDSGITTYEAKSGGKSKQALVQKEAQNKAKSLVQRNFHVYFPTHDTVKGSISGSAGTICFQSKWYNSPTFPKSLMRDCRSKREGMLMHNKVIYVTNTAQPWAYIGSANCSESAWGSLSKDRSLKVPKLNCRNWECGVLIPARHLDAENYGEQEKLVGDSKFSASVETAFDRIFPVPMLFPGAEYRSKEPWYYSEDQTRGRS